LASPFVTVTGMSAVAAITAGLLVAAGVGDGESRSVRDARARENRINDYTQRLASDIVYGSGLDCGVIEQPGAGISILVDASTIDDLPEDEWLEVSKRIEDEVQSECRKSRR